METDALASVIQQLKVKNVRGYHEINVMYNSVLTCIAAMEDLALKIVKEAEDVDRACTSTS